MSSVLLLLLASLLSLASNHCNAQSYPTLSLLDPSFPHLSSVAIDSTDYLYVLNHTTVVEFNAPRSVVWTIDLSQSLKHPVAIKVDTAGQLHISDVVHRAVLVFDSEGDQLGVYDGTKGAESDGKPMTPAGLAFDRAGLLYVVDTANSRVVVFDTGSGNVTRYVDIPNGGSRQQLVDVVVDCLNVVYVSDVGNGRIVVMNQVNNTMTAEWVDQLYRPIGLAIDSSNLIYVADYATNVTFVYNTAGQQLWQQKWNSYQLSPRWLAVNSAGQLFVGDVAHHTVGMVDGIVLPGTILSVISGQSGPLAVSVSNTSLLLVVNSLPTNIEAIQLYQYNYNYYAYPLTTVNASSPSGVAISNAGNLACQTDLYVVHCYRVNGYHSGQLVTTLSMQPVSNIATRAIAVAVDDVQLLIYVLGTWWNPQYPQTSGWPVQVFNFAGQYIRSLDYGLSGASGIAVSPLNGNTYISDTANGRIVVADRQGTQLHAYTGYQQPNAIAVDSSNNIYFTAVGQLIVLDYRGNRLYTIEHGFNGERSVAVDKLGRIILADGNNNRLVVMQGIQLPVQQQINEPKKEERRVERE